MEGNWKVEIVFGERERESILARVIMMYLVEGGGTRWPCRSYGGDPILRLRTVLVLVKRAATELL